jgi:hypothetical protein
MMLGSFVPFYDLLDDRKQDDGQSPQSYIQHQPLLMQNQQQQTPTQQWALPDHQYPPQQQARPDPRQRGYTNPSSHEERQWQGSYPTRQASLHQARSQDESERLRLNRESQSFIAMGSFQRAHPAQQALSFSNRASAETVGEPEEMARMESTTARERYDPGYMDPSSRRMH